MIVRIACSPRVRAVPSRLCPGCARSMVRSSAVLMSTGILDLLVGCCWFTDTVDSRRGGLTATGGEKKADTCVATLFLQGKKKHLENYRRRDSHVSAGRPRLGGAAMSRRGGQVSAGQPGLGGTAMSRRDSHVSAGQPGLGGTARSRRLTFLQWTPVQGVQGQKHSVQTFVR
jgi:hypothetical protein